MHDLVTKIAQYKYFSTLDLKSAYHQVEIPVEDRPYTAFQALRLIKEHCVWSH